MTTAVEAAALIRSDLKRLGYDGCRVSGYRANHCEVVVIKCPPYQPFTVDQRLKLFRLGELYGWLVRKDNRFKRTVLYTVKDH